MGEPRKGLRRLFGRRPARRSEIVQEAHGNTAAGSLQQNIGGTNVGGDQHNVTAHTVLVSQAAAGDDTGASESQDAAFARERREYLHRVCDRYRRVDLEILTPLDAQDEHPEMLLREVFVPQNVRENPPPFELLDLPREVLRRLADGEHIPALPDRLDRERLEQARPAYRDRPAHPVLDALARTDRAVILGGPGAGKSTLARFAMLALATAELEPHTDTTTVPADWEGRLPLLVELRSYADPMWRGRGFLDLIDELGREHNLGLPKTRLKAFLDDGGRALVVFDGLDEIFDPDTRADVVARIEGFASLYRGVRTIVTSRVIGYRRAALDAAGFTTHMLQDLEPAQIEAFATAWYDRSCKGDPQAGTRMRARLLDAIADSKAVAELAGNPMLLTILAIIARRRELPRDRRTVYRHAVTVLIEHWDVNKHLGHTENSGLPRPEPDDKLAMLHRVARRMQDGPAGLAGNHLAAKDLIEELTAYFTDELKYPHDRARTAARAILSQFQHRNFILSSFGAGLYGFVHRAFLEYLAADDINERLTNRDLEVSELLDLFATHAHDPAWRETLLLLVGMIPNKFAAAVTRLRDATPTWQPHLRLPTTSLLALSAVGEIRHLPTLTSLAPDTTRLLIRLLTEAARRERTYNSSLIEALRSRALPTLDQPPAWLDAPRYQVWYQTSGYALRRAPATRHTAARLHLATRNQTPTSLHHYATSDTSPILR
ncbi:NACHT domain-containing protein [Embleya sp. NPDC055664]